MTSFINELKKETNYTLTDNGAVSHYTTLSKIYDMFALGAAYRNRTDDDCILLFKNALEENAEMALKCLFYIRDIRGGQGERRFFRVCLKWLAQEHSEMVARNIENIAEMGRWDDLDCLFDTPCENDALYVMKRQFELDMEGLKSGDNQGISLLAKWLHSVNGASHGELAQEHKRIGEKTRKYFCLSQKEYRKVLSALRTRINLLEKLMTEGRWAEIEYDKIPSKAGIKYRNAFAKRDGERYTDFVSNKDNKVNAGTLYPYEIVKEVIDRVSYYSNSINMTETQREILNKYWNNLPDYCKGKNCRIMPICDTSGSMTTSYGSGIRPIDIAISLSMYCAERISGQFQNHYISFSDRPQFISIEGVDFVDKVRRIYQTNLCSNTDLNAVFDLLLDVYTNPEVERNTLPTTLVIISDMNIDRMSYWRSDEAIKTNMESIRTEWNKKGLTMPNLVYWNVNAKNNLILDNPELPGISFVSGASPILFESVIAGKSGIQLMIDKLLSDRYINIR